MKTLLLLPALLTIQTLFAQTDSHLQLSDQFPAAGEKISFTYDPAGTNLDGKANIAATVFYLDNKDYPAVDVDLKADGKLLKGELSVPATAKAFFVKVEAGGEIDNNNEAGYIYLVTKNKQPVEGAYASKAYALSSGVGTRFAKIKMDKAAAIELFKKEFAAYPATKQDYELNYYQLVAKDAAYTPEIESEIAKLGKSDLEKDQRQAWLLLYYIKQAKRADSLATLIKGEFPAGTLAKNDLITMLYQEKDLHKKDSLFNVYAAKFPEKTGDPATSLDEALSVVATAHLRNEDMAGYNKYAVRVKNKMEIAGSLNGVAWGWAEAGKNLADAEKISKQSVDIITKGLENPPLSAFTSARQAKENYEGSYNAFADTYSYILWKENKSAEALPYMKTVYDRTSDEENSTEHYAEVLGGAGQYAKAMEVIEKGFKQGQYSSVLKEELKKDYIKVKGSEKGFDQYLAPFMAASKAKILEELAKTMINQPAPAFALKDFDGKTVSLTDLKGKVVIVDFWATWCGPCKASFPGMQMAVDKYKNDPNVKFLFVNTAERGNDYADGVKKFIADNKYTFHVLMDEKNDEGRPVKVLTAYGVEGIPTKFMIDKSGNIRFKYVGYSGSPEKVLDEVSNMIELTRDQKTASAPVAKESSGK